VLDRGQSLDRLRPRLRSSRGLIDAVGRVREIAPPELEPHRQFLTLRCPSAPEAQWIEQRFPKPRALVRFRSGALKNPLLIRATCCQRQHGGHQGATKGPPRRASFSRWAQGSASRLPTHSTGPTWNRWPTSAFSEIPVVTMCLDNQGAVHSALNELAAGSADVTRPGVELMI
jgi:hypothetical protein